MTREHLMIAARNDCKEMWSQHGNALPVPAPPCAMKQAFVRKQRIMAQSFTFPLELQLGGVHLPRFAGGRGTSPGMVSGHAAGSAPD